MSRLHTAKLEMWRPQRGNVVGNTVPNPKEAVLPPPLLTGVWELL